MTRQKSSNFFFLKFSSTDFAYNLFLKLNFFEFLLLCINWMFRNNVNLKLTINLNFSYRTFNCVSRLANSYFWELVTNFEKRKKIYLKFYVCNQTQDSTWIIYVRSNWVTIFNGTKPKWVLMVLSYVESKK